MVLLPGPTFVQVRIQGGVRIINPTLTILSIRLYFPNLGTLIHYLGPLVPFSPLGLMGPHILAIGVWGTLLEVNFQLLHVHA